MGTKLITLDELSPQGEPTIQIIRPQDMIKLAYVKVASDALEYIKTVKPQEGRTIILVLALTASDWYGPNKNGDSFNENDVTAGPVHIPAEDGLRNYYKTFETNANVFLHHQNKDPTKRLGEILKSFYNPKMHRVELVISLDNNKAADIVERIEHGEFPAVSMGTKVKYDVCFLAGTSIETGASLVPIEEIERGDLVRTHTGRLLTTSTIIQREYTGRILGIKTHGISDTTQVTPNHRFLAIKEDALRQCWGSANQYKRRCTPDNTGSCCVCKKKLPTPNWISAEELDVGDYLAYPIPTHTEAKNVNPDIAYLYGTYLGNGSIGQTRRGRKRTGEYHITSIQWSFGFDWRDVANKTIGILQQNITTHTITQSEYPEKHEIRVSVGARDFAKNVEEQFGKGSHEKYIPAETTSWNRNARWALIAGYLDTDGCVDPNKGNARFNSVSKNLIYSLRILFASLGIATAIHEESTFSSLTGRYVATWVLFIDATTVTQLAEYSIKAKTFCKNTRFRSNCIRLQNYILSPITDITETEVQQLPVYNLQVAEDESYIANGSAVHNCSICGNKAPNRSQYCDHAKFHLADVLPDGRRISVWNPRPNFFDISIVRRPADRIAFMMKKVAEPIEIVSSAELGEKWEAAQHKAAQLHKLSVIEKAISSEVPLAKTDDGSIHGLGAFENTARKAAENMPPIGDDDIRKMLVHKPAEVLSTLASLGIILTTPEFLKFFIWKLEPNAQISEEILRRAVSIQKAVFDLLANNTKLLDDVHDSGFVDISGEKVSEEIAKKFEHLIEKRSQLGSYLYRHAVPEWAKSPTTKGKWDVLNVTDPQTGRQYQTTRGTAEKAQDWAVEHRVPELLGGGLLLGGAYKLLTHPKLRFLAPLAAIPGAAFIWRGMTGYPAVRAQTGEEISLPRQRLPFEPRGLPWMTRGGTELAEKRSSDQGVINEGSALITLIQDHLHTGARGEKLARLIDTEKWEEDSFDRVAQALGNLICKT